MEPLDRAPDRLGAELERVDRDPLVRRVDQLRELEALRQPHRQEAVGLHAGREKKRPSVTPIWSSGTGIPSGSSSRITLRERVEEAEIGLRRAGIVPDELELDVLADERLQLCDQLLGRESRQRAAVQLELDLARDDVDLLRRRGRSSR